MDESCSVDDGVALFKSQINRALLFCRSVFPYSTTLPYNFQSSGGLVAYGFLTLYDFAEANVLPFNSCYWHMRFDYNNFGCI